MTDVTVKSLAAEIQTPVDRLVQQFADAGIKKSDVDSVTQQEKEILLAHLNREHGSVPNKLTLQRKTRSTLNIPSTGGKSKSVQIEVRKKRTYVNTPEAEQAKAEEQAQREAEEQAQREAEATAQKIAEEKAKREAEEQAKREAAEKAKRQAAEKEKVTNQQTDEKLSQLRPIKHVVKLKLQS